MIEVLSIHRLPHQPPMRWIIAAERGDDGTVACLARVPGACGEDGRASILLGLEILAQAAGMLLAAALEPAESAPAGRLLNVKTARWQQDSLPLENDIHALITRIEGSAIGLHRFAGCLSDASGTFLLEAEFNLLVRGPAQ